MAIIVPNIPALTIPTPPAPPAELAPFVYRAYGTLIQDYLDGRIQDFSAYYTPIAVVRAELELERDKVFRKYHKGRKDYLKAEGKKCATGMPGHVQRQLMELDLDEKRELSESAAKITATRMEQSLAAVEQGAELALRSDAIRSETHYKVQAASFEAAKAALMAGYQHAALRISAFENWLKAIATEFELVEIESKALAQAVEAEISAVKIKIIAAESIGFAEELQKVQAELEVSKAQIDEVLSRLPLVQAEIRKAYAEIDVLEAEKVLATFKELTALASMDKSEARMGEIAIAQQRIALQLAEVGLKGQKDSAETSGELSGIAARVAEGIVETAKEALQIRGTEADADLTHLKADIVDADTDMERIKVRYLAERAIAQQRLYNDRARDRAWDMSNRTYSTVRNIHLSSVTSAGVLTTIASNTAGVLSSTTSTAMGDLARRADDSARDIKAVSDSLEGRLDAQLETERGAMNQLLTAERTNINERINAAVLEAMNTAANMSTGLHARAGLLVSQQSQTSSQLYDDVMRLESDFETWKGAHEADVAAEAAAIVAAAEQAANADVQTEFHYIKG